MSTPRFDLVDIVQTLQKKGRYILIVTLLAGVVGTIIYLVSPKQYQARSEFFVSNPQYGDRSNVFRNVETQFISYFGDEDDIDRVMAIAKSELVRHKVLEKQDLAKVYGLDTGKKADMVRLTDRFKKNFDFKRTEYQNMEVSYTDTDPQIAANVTNEAVGVIEQVYRGYYNTIKENITESLESKIKETDSAIAQMTDTLSRLRDKYNIYDIISPSRETMISGTIKSNGVSGFGKAIEEIQNIEATKDQLVKDRASYVSLINEFTTGTKMNEMPLLHVITSAAPPTQPKGLGLVLTVVASLLIGFLFSCIWVLFRGYFSALAAVERS